MARAEEPAPGGGTPAAPAAGKGGPEAVKAPKAKARSPKKKKRPTHRKRRKTGRRRHAGLQAGPGLEANSYTVQKGDNLWTIAKKTGVDPGTLAALNDVDAPSLSPGQKLLLEAPPAPAAAEGPQAAPAEPPVAASDVGENGEPAPPSIRERLVEAAARLVDIPYRFGGSTLLGIDCSGYVQKVFGFLGVSLPRTAREMFGLGKEVSREELSLGDLVFFRTYATFPSHVGIYIGNNMFIHASSREKKVRIDRMDAPYYHRKFLGAKRLPLEGEGADAETR